MSFQTLLNAWYDSGPVPNWAFAIDVSGYINSPQGRKREAFEKREDQSNYEFQIQRWRLALP
jgi:hypothetical protein